MSASGEGTSESGLVAAGPLADDVQFRQALDAMLDHVAVGVAVRDTSGSIVDFVLTYMNRASVDGAGRSGSELVGGRLLEMYPHFEEQGLFSKFVEVVEAGVPFVSHRLRYEDVTPSGHPISGYWSLSVVRLGDGYLAASRDVSQWVADDQARVAAELEAERSRFSVEILQRAALPASLPMMEGIDIGARYQPASQGQSIGGDWYDAFDLGGGRLAVLVADVAGHGPEAAAFMVQVRTIVRAMAHEHHLPSAVLRWANVVLGRMGEHDLFATCCYGVVEAASSTFSWARAGHLPPLLLSGAARILESDGGPPLGVDADATYPVATVTLAPGDVLLLCTDGLVEVRDQEVGASLETLLRRMVDRTPTTAQALADEVVGDVLSPTDDIAVLCVRMLA